MRKFYYPNILIMIPDKFNIWLIISILFLSCGFVVDSNDYTVSPLVGTWNLTTISYFENQSCSGVPFATLDVNSPENLADFGLDVYQVQLTVTIDSYVIVLAAYSGESGEWAEDAATGRMVDHGGEYCVLWDTVEDRDDCDECKNYTINRDEINVYMYGCHPGGLPSPTGDIGPCQILTFIKQQ